MSETTFATGEEMLAIGTVGLVVIHTAHESGPVRAQAIAHSLAQALQTARGNNRARLFAAMGPYFDRSELPELVHRCSCGLAFSREAWEALRYVGRDELGEYRNCHCGSTMILGGA